MRLYDTYTRSLAELPPAPGLVRMYFCGPTVYARAHVGNARPFVVGMWLRSWLRATGYDATLVHNITDINDKIYDAAPGASAELAERATAWYLEDTGDLGLGMPDHLPKATDSVPQIVRFIEELIETEHAYPIDGDVYFRVASFPAYGRLSGQKPDQVEQGEARRRVLLGDGHDEAQVGLDEPPLGCPARLDLLRVVVELLGRQLALGLGDRCVGQVAGLDGLGELDLVDVREQRVLADLPEVLPHQIFVRCLLLLEVGTRVRLVVAVAFSTSHVDSPLSVRTNGATASLAPGDTPKTGSRLLKCSGHLTI